MSVYFNDDNDMTNVGACCRCRAPMALPTSLYHAAKHSPDIKFFCAYGHKQHFVADETEVDKLRRERDSLKQQLAHKDDAIASIGRARDHAERRAAAARGQVTRIKNRIGAGVCPCCNRTFKALAAHMASEHPTYRAETAE